jgi:hypothetical protein
MGFYFVLDEFEVINHTVCLCVGLSSICIQAVVCLALCLLMGRLVGFYVLSNQFMAACAMCVCVCKRG